MRKLIKYMLIVFFTLMQTLLFAQTTAVSANPNPFKVGGTSTYTTILVRGNTSEAMSVKIQIYDLLGKLVWSKERIEYLTSDYSENWDGKNSKGIYVRSGVYVLFATKIFQGDRGFERDKIRLAVIRVN
ncbi:MAG: T9SS type A sorting domain-containing protein [Spirochaetes bacterium]|nr:T9SS type A sorting domain-containing protein [Spirochaetota bacterium]